MNEQNRKTLLEIARQSIQYGLEHHQPMPIEAGEMPEELLPTRCTFVTLEKRGELRGCIGSVHPVRSIAEDVAHNAYAAAFHDPRFPSVVAEEADILDIHISLLSDFEAMNFRDEADLVSQIRPHVDGLILSDGGQQGLFLPSVWESLPHVQDFMDHLKRKAGLPHGHWSNSIGVRRFTVESFP